jgi:hypothetical protein
MLAASEVQPLGSLRVRPPPGWSIRLSVCAVWMAIALLGFACGSTISPATPTGPTHTPDPNLPVPANPANVAGNWTGTLESAGAAPRTISVLAFQTAACVDGAWNSDPAEWVGAISGYADVGSFSGSISIQRPADGPGKCGGVGTFSGEVGDATIRWTSSGFTGECAGGLPQAVTITLRRQ